MYVKCSVCKQIFLTFEKYQIHTKCKFKPNYIKGIPKQLGFICL